MIRSLAAAALLLSSQVASAQSASSCLTRQEVSDLMIFALPSVLNAAAERCAATLPPTAFLRSGSAQMIARFKSEGTTRWAAVRRAVEKIGNEKLPAGIKDETVRLLLQDVMGAEFVKDIKTRDCQEIDDLVQAISPLPAQNVGTMIGSILSLAGDGDKKAPFRVCEAP